VFDGDSSDFIVFPLQDDKTREDVQEDGMG
jgi:hypothetical protein